MTKLEELAAELEAAETVEQINEVKGAIEAEQAREAAIAEKAAILDGMKAAKPQPVKADEAPKTLGEFAEKSLDLTAVRSGMSKSAGTGYGFKAYTDPQTSQQMLVTSQTVTDSAIRDLEVRRAFGSEQISGNALKYFILGAKEDNSAPSPKGVSEAAAKPQFHIVESSATVTLQKIAGWFYETDELLEDNAFLKSALDARGLYELDAAVEAYLLTTLLATSGLGARTYTHGSDVSADDVFKAMMDVKSNSGLNADTVILNPADYQILRLSKDGASQYYGGGCFYGPYANANLDIQPGLWGMRTIVTPNIASGTLVVGAFKQGASVITKAGEGQRIEVFVGDHDDAIYNRVTVVVEERLGLAVRRPGAFCKLTEALS